MDSRGLYVLHKNVLTKDLDTAKFCVNIGHNLDCPIKDGDPAFLIAIKFNLSDIASYLAEMSCNVNVVNKMGLRANENAFCSKSHDLGITVNRITERVKRIRFNEGNMLLSALQSGNVSGVSKILGYSGQADAFNRRMRIHLSDVLKPFLTETILHATMCSGDTPISIVFIEGRDDIVKLLLDSGANIHCRGRYDFNPLHNCTILRHFEVGKTQVQMGSLLNIKSSDGELPS